MNLADFQRMFAYDTWANGEVLASFRKSGAGPKSVKFMAHVLAAGQLWLDRLVGVDQKVVVWPEPSIDQCEAKVAELGTRWQEFLKKTGERGLARIDHERRSATVVHGQVHTEESLATLVDQLKFLRVDGEHYAEVGGPKAVAVFAVAIEGKGGARVLLAPTKRGYRIFLRGS